MITSKTIAYGVALGITLSVVALVAVPKAGATPGPRGERKVTICHANDSHTKQYTVNWVDKSSIDEVNNKYLNGHGDHEGGVWYEGIADHSWGDIIPPFTNDAGNSFPGQNWTTEGQKIYNNNCKVPTQTTDPETPVDPETPNNGGQGGGEVLGEDTGELADTGASHFLSFIAGASLLGSTGFVTVRSRVLAAKK